MNRRAILCVFLVSLIVGCVPWTKVGGTYTSGDMECRAELPEGWRKHNMTSDALLITRDGMTLQWIRIERTPLDDELEHTKKKLGKDMLPHEVAEIIVDDLRSDSGMLKLAVMDHEPADVGGTPAFRLLYTHETPKGLDIKTLRYGFITDTWFYSLMYSAPARHYFDRDIAAFEEVTASFELVR
jgi:hypothetical protein